jgi:3-(methylthio)propionyl---CoA ligase
MHGLMQDRALLVSTLIEHAEREHPRAEIVARRHDGVVRQTYAQLGPRARRLAQAMLDLGIRSGDRVATLAWNTDRHLELYYAICGIGAVCHTINPRLFDNQVSFIINDAADRILFVDIDILPLVARCLPDCPGVERVVVLGEAHEMPTDFSVPPAVAVQDYESLLAGAEPLATWPDLDERSAAALCYTSGTTGMPKGVLYSHRALVLHTYGVCMADTFGVSAVECAMPVVPMFHVMAWGFPFAAAASGMKLVLPGAKLDGASLQQLIIDEGVTVSAGVPTIWLGLANQAAQGGGLGDLTRIISGGAAIPVALVEAFEGLGVRVQQAWGMTEISPVAGVNAPTPATPRWPSAEYNALQRKQGRVPFGVQIKTVDDEGRELPRDGHAVGHIKLRGWWVLSGYFNHPELTILDEDGWFATGDIGTIDENGFLQITDRAKDVVKSGGEWISSQELENLAAGHPSVMEAAVIGVPHPKWDERPMLICVRAPGASVEADELRAFYKGKVASWCIPDTVAFIDEMPHTATGKLDKLALRKRFVPAG